MTTSSYTLTGFPISTTSADATRVLAGGLGTPGLIANVLVNRYCDHLPLYRQSKIFARCGLGISRSTLSGWIGAACWWLEALHDRLVAHVMAGDRVSPTTRRCRCSILDAVGPRPDASGPARAMTAPTAAMPHLPWSFTIPLTAQALAQLSISRRSAAAYRSMATLASRRWQTRISSPWPPVGRTPRRKFFELHEAGSPVATEAGQRIGELYEIEATIRGQPPNERLRVRRRQSQPLVEVLQGWLDLQLLRPPGRSRLAEAIRYALGRWSALTRFLDNGRVDLDTNPVERAIRPIALGRKNSLFAGSEGGANRWAIIASLAETAKLDGIEPFAWLRDSLTMMVDGHTVNRLDDLLTWLGRAGYS